MQESRAIKNKRFVYITDVRIFHNASVETGLASSLQKL